MAADLEGIVFNEVLIDPNGSINFDTDGSGNPESEDEFLELYNTGSTIVDISGWQIYDNTTLRHTFPSGTEIAPGDYLALVTHDSDVGSPYINNGGDTLALYNPNTDQYIAVAVGNNPAALTSTIPGTQVGNTDSFGGDTDGQSLQRFGDGSDNIVDATPTPNATNECFVTGTLISTANGEVAVEDLKVGDVVKTATGLEAIKWIGRQTVQPENVQNPMRGYPILIKAGALGHNLPVRDLYVSPDHALLVDGLLINAGALVNSVSIIQTEPADTFTYFHVELEKHALLISEGAYAESYLPQKEDRDCYENAAEYTELYPEGPSVMLWPMDYPRVSSYTTVPRYVRKRLQAIADALYGAGALQTV